MLKCRLVRLNITMTIVMLVLILPGCKTDPSSSTPQVFKVIGETPAKKTVFSEIREYVKSEKGKMNWVSTIDMIHVGPDHFYKKIIEYIESKREKFGSKVIQLREGFIRDWPYCVALDKFDLNQIKFLFKKVESQKQAADVLGLISSQHINNLFKLGILKKKPCGYKSQRQAFADSVEKLEWTTQHNFQRQFKSASYDVLGDIKETKLKPGYNLLGALDDACHANPNCSKEHPIAKWIQSIEGQYYKTEFEQLKHTKREQSVKDLIKQAHSKGYTWVIIPWGEHHMPNFYKFLEEEGFTLLKMTSTPLIECSILKTDNEDLYKELCKRNN